ncbi:MAG: hypothetical protein R2827_05610 [Bdellovibrionales bacterium]
MKKLVTFQQAVLPSFNSYAEVFLDTYLPYSHQINKANIIASIYAGETRSRQPVVREFYMESNGQLNSRNS